MSSPAYDIATIIASCSNMPSIGTGLYVSSEPTAPDNTITVFDTGGFEPSPEGVYQRPTVQIRVRNTNYGAGYAILEEIRDTLHATGSFSQSGFLYTGIWAMQEITSLGYDANNRILLVLNLRIHRTT